MLQALVDAAKEAGREILEVYGTAFAVEYKADRSPLTEADRRSHELIMERLGQLRLRRGTEHSF
jgi:3'(2'), 5'-bisphosphate nucleotidase